MTCQLEHLHFLTFGRMTTEYSTSRTTTTITSDIWKEWWIDLWLDSWICKCKWPSNLVSTFHLERDSMNRILKWRQLWSFKDADIGRLTSNTRWQLHTYDSNGIVQKTCLDQRNTKKMWRVRLFDRWIEIHFVTGPCNTELRTTRYMITFQK